MTDTCVLLPLSPPAGRDPRAMDARGPVQAQRVPMAAGMQGPVPHGMGSNAPPPTRPVKQLHVVVHLLDYIVLYKKATSDC